MSSLLIVGIGNPGEKYKNNRHNFGFKVIDYLSKKLEIGFEFDKKKSIFGKKDIDDNTVILLKPQTFANLSGEAVLYLASFLKVELKNIVIIFDNPYHNLGEVHYLDGMVKSQEIKEIKNGAIQSLISSLNSSIFNVIELGIGPVIDEEKIEEFCLQNFNEDEKKEFDEIYSKVYSLIDFFIENS